MRVGGLVPLTTIDFPGELAAAVFLQGCPWRCRYCHNPALLPARSATALPWEDILTFLKKRQGLLDAVVFSGGEPTLHAQISGAIKATKALGYKIGLHTAGVYPRRLASVLPLIDWVGLDIKALPDDYAAITTVEGSGRAAWESARLVVDSGVAHQMRITVHPQLTSPEQSRDIKSRLYRIGARAVVEQSCRTETCLDPDLRQNIPTVRDSDDTKG